MAEEKDFRCSTCGAVWQKRGETDCWSKDPSKSPGKPAYCPTQEHGQMIEDTFEAYSGDSDDARMARVASRVEGLCYEPVPGTDIVNARWTRVEDTIAFCRLMGYERLGIATCIGMLDETQKLMDVLKAQGFKPQSVCCKTGSLDKLRLGLKEEEKVRPGTFEPACNPIAQAKLLNQAKTDINIIVGLCIGHDILLTKYSEAPVTTLVVKDRVTGHNPVSVLYGQNFYYKRLQKQKLEVPGEEDYSR